jgi:FKBP-type peptidyl-prolyl cis-trans isomerase (trigger factor)
MHITKEETGALTASIKMQITKEDYEEKVTKTLKDYQRKANMPGFRPGKVPFGMVSKMYRKGVLLDEINHLIAENLQKYIEESQLKLIGNPIPDKEKATVLDLDTNSEFEFFFDIGLAPEFEVDLSENLVVEALTIRATDKMIDEHVEELRQRFNIHVPHEEVEGEEHHHEELPELNEEFFNKVFPGQEVKEISDFRQKIKEAIEHSLVKESERFFLNSVIEKLVKDTNIELPDAFLRKMLRENDENSLSEEEIEKQYPNFTNSVKWQLIEARIIRDNNLRVHEEEMRNVVKSYFTGSLVNLEENPEHDERLNKIVDSVLSNKEEAGRLHDQLFDQKLMAFFKEKVKPVAREVDYDEFVKMVTQKKD